MTIDRAIAWAGLGWRPIPVGGPDGKRPVLPQWTERASSDAATVREYWRDAPGVGLVTGRDPRTGVTRIVIDVDRKDVDGMASLYAAGIDPDSIRTLKVRTPSGGMHLYFETTEAVANRVGVLPSVDVRGEGGQVVAPGTVTPAGAYAVIDGAAIAPLPDSIRAILSAQTSTTPAAARVSRAAMLGTEGLTDMPGAAERAAQWLAEQPTVDEGRNLALFQRAAKVRNFGVSRETAHDMLALHVVEKFGAGSHDFTEREIARTVASAYDNPQSAFGRDWKPAVDLSGAGTAPGAHTIEWFSGTAASAALLPPRPWLAEGLTMRGIVSVLVAPGATSKSTWTLQYLMAQCLCDTAPRETIERMLGRRYVDALRGPIRALLINNEDGRDELERRALAICQHFGLDHSQLHSRLALASGAADEWRMAARHAETRTIETGPQFERVRDWVRANNIDVVVFDPFVSFHDAQENSNDEMQRVVSQFKKLAATLQVSVVLVHHTTKPPAASSESYAGNINAGRGASAVKDAARVGLTLYTCGTKDGEAWGIPEPVRHRYVRLDDAKQNLIAGSPDPQWYCRESVSLANGDSVGVLVSAALQRVPPKEKKRKTRGDDDGEN